MMRSTLATRIPGLLRPGYSIPGLLRPEYSIPGLLRPSFASRAVLPAGQAQNSNAVAFFAAAGTNCAGWVGMSQGDKNALIQRMSRASWAPNPVRLVSESDIAAFSAQLDGYCTDPKTVKDLGLGCLDWAQMDSNAQSSAASGWLTDRGFSPDPSRISAIVSAVNGACVDPRTLTTDGLAANCTAWEQLQPGEKRGRVQALANSNGWAFSPYDVQVGAQSVDSNCLQQAIAGPPQSFRPYSPIAMVGRTPAPQQTPITPTPTTPTTPTTATVQPASKGIPWVPLLLGAGAVLAVVYFTREST